VAHPSLTQAAVVAAAARTVLTVMVATVAQVAVDKVGARQVVLQQEQPTQVAEAVAVEPIQVVPLVAQASLLLGM